MNYLQKMLIDSYTTLVMAERMKIEDVPETKSISGFEYVIQSEVEIEIAQRTIAAIY